MGFGEFKKIPRSVSAPNSINDKYRDVIVIEINDKVIEINDKTWVIKSVENIGYVTTRDEN